VRRAHSTRRAGAIVLAVAAAVLLPGCDGSTPGTGTGTGSAGTSRTTDPPTSSPAPATDEREAVETAYRRFWAVSWDVDKQPAARWRAVLATVAADPELTRLYAGTKAQQQAGIRLYGQVRARPTVRRVAGSRATVADCQDASQAGQADARTGKPKTVGVARSPVEAAMLRGADGVWRVSDVRYTGGSC
jgi:hypothetical protein